MRLLTGVAVAAASLVFVPAALADTTVPPTLSVDGSGSVMVKPDVASLSVSVSRSAAKSADALSMANQRTDAIVAAVKAAGVPASGIQTDQVNVFRRTIKVGPHGHQHKVRRYTASESLSITTTTALVGNVIDLATRAGANSIDGPDFSFSDPSAGEVAATNAAIADARTRANAAAAALGYTVTGVQSIDLDPGSGVVVPGGASGTASTGAPAAPKTPTTIHPGTEEVDASVEVVYTIAPAS
jgi:uncharacterized protein YggE